MKFFKSIVAVGLVAASTPDAGGAMVVLSLERLNQTIDVDVRGRTVRVDGGKFGCTIIEAVRVEKALPPDDR